MLTLTIFTATGCQKCRKTLEKLVDLVESLKDDVPQITFKVINITERPELAVKHGINTTPTILIGNDTTLRGAPSKRVLTDAIKKSLREKIG